ncbi:hypothetical protein M2139_002864 [Enterococcus sp. PF1-24]|uniref:hypothetical protein n=1 Tax=unclassified Enterococcus TaxID=2608891 RepID=UPI002475D438|nr:MULTISPECIES: hypothetical protein [unclassified Enterococcus]MDH6365841.1 hypothetical protein [Enterococcus sp. PFB1-1]MDH6402933.1 hypothetical protein [Enterococcus sp. PF1-24]
MSTKRVAGTIMLHLQDGSKKFLLQNNDEGIDFAITNFSEEATGLASMLRYFKEKVPMDVTNIELVELTNICFENKKIPFFVFSAKEADVFQEDLSENFFWEESTKIGERLENFEISGVPLF